MDENKIYDVPCKCLNCGNLYLSGNKIIGKLLMGEFANAWRNTGHSGSGWYACPACSSQNHFNIDLIDDIENSIAALKLVPLAELLNLENKLKSLITSNLTPNDVKAGIDSIQELAPTFKNFKSFRPTTKSDYYALFAIVISIIGIVAPLLTSNPTTPPESHPVEKTINYIENNYPVPKSQFYNPKKIKQIHPGQKKHTPKIGRNDPCHCGSGSKFKNCHGKN